MFGGQSRKNGLTDWVDILHSIGYIIYQNKTKAYSPFGYFTPIPDGVSNSDYILMFLSSIFINLFCTRKTIHLIENLAIYNFRKLSQL